VPYSRLPEVANRLSPLHLLTPTDLLSCAVQIYCSTKIVIDDANHVTLPWGSVNSRVFDALACGALVITNGRLGSQDTFDEELPVYSGVAGAAPLACCSFIPAIRLSLTLCLLSFALSLSPSAVSLYLCLCILLFPSLSPDLTQQLQYFLSHEKERVQLVRILQNKA
jgi:hypothetical protein